MNWIWGILGCINRNKNNNSYYLNVYIPYDPCIPLLGVYPNKMHADVQ